MAEQTTIKTLDLTKGEGGIQAKPGIGPVIGWHGVDVNLQAVPESLANKMADDKQTRYISRTTAAPAAKAEAKAAPSGDAKG